MGLGVKNETAEGPDQDRDCITWQQTGQSWNLQKWRVEK